MTPWFPFEALVWGFVAVAFVSAYLPWLSDRIGLKLLTSSGEKNPWVRIGEWLVLYFLIGAIGRGLEYPGDRGRASAGLGVLRDHSGAVCHVRRSGFYLAL